MNSSFFRRTLAATFAAALVAGGSSRVMAEDIDIFTAGSGGVAPPNLLVILDNSSNWNSTLGANTCNTGNMADNTKFAAEVCAFTELLNVIPVPPVGGLVKLRLGLMMFDESGNNGGYMRFGMRDMNVPNRDAFLGMMQGFVANGSGTDNSGSNQPYAKVMYEAFKYFGGYTCPAHSNDDVSKCSTSTNDQTHFGPTAFAGGPDNNTGSYRRDYPNNNSGPNRAAARYGADNNAALASSSATDYTSPITDICAKNFIVFISNGNPGTGGDSSTNPARDTAIMSNISAPITAWPNASNEIHASKMDEMAYYLRHTDVDARAGQQYVITYTIAVYQPQSITFNADGTVNTETISNTDQQMIKLMKSAADLGGGKFCQARKAEDVLACLLDIVNEVQAVNSVFVSASLPVSVNNQGTFLNQVYMGMFRPDGSGNPRWLGNLKEYKFALDTLTGSISLADAKTPSTQAVNPATGFISPAAWSFWTRRGNDPTVPGWPNRDFWINNPSGSPANGSDALDAAHGDGEVVEKGGASEMLRLDFATSQDSRRVFTCPLPASTGCAINTAPADFNSTLVTGTTYQSAFRAASSSELSLLVDWYRGSDNFNGTPCDITVSPCTWTSSELGPGWTTTAPIVKPTVRPSIHGDVLHSRPVVINYGPSCPAPPPQPASPTGKCGPWVFYGANDGTLRAVKGGQDNTIAAKDGHESWSFIAPEFFGKVKRLRDTSPRQLMPSTPPELLILPNPPLPKDYFFDGPIGVWEDPDSGARWIFVTARRGGALIYAFDVTDPTAPVFKWRKSAADLPNLGQTWSTPFIFKLDGDTDPTLVMGAGYDTGEDSSPAVANGSTGRGIYVLNANDGSVKNGGDVVAGFMSHGQNADIADSVPSDVSLLVSTQGQVYRGYFGDTGGNIWRLDIPDNNVSHWKLFKFAALGAGRKFFYAPDIVHAGSFDVVLAGTGDREKPLVKTSSDSFYALNDPQNNPAAVAPSMTALVPGDLVLLSTTTGITAATGTCTGGVCVCSPPICKGWYRNMAAGEKIVNSPLTVAGTTYFSTNKPIASTSACVTNLGEARAYGFSFFGGTPNKTQPDGTMGQPLTGGGLPPSPVGGVVEITPGQNVAFIIGAGDKGSSVEGGRITIPVSSTRRKVYWNQSRDN
jgi:type IV pilus assembly protein PilY1